MNSSNFLNQEANKKNKTIDPFLKLQQTYTSFLITSTQSIKIPFLRWNIWEHIVLIASTSKWILLSVLVGTLAGSASALFLTLLSSATSFRISHPWLLWFLPLCGFTVGYIYYKWGTVIEKGNNLILDNIHKPSGVIPILMLPMILFSTVLTHLFGGSAGREGTAVQMGGALASWVANRLSLRSEDIRLTLMAGMSAGFGAVFGTPLAGAVFGMEVQSVGSIRYEGIIPCLIASIVGDLVCRWWGVGHTHYKQSPAVLFNVWLFSKLIIAGIVFGLAALLFSELTHAISENFKRLISWPPLRPVIGGFIIIALTYLVGSQDYLGLSLPLLTASTDGSRISNYAFLFKIIFTAITLGTGFKGGEVTPLFVIGATLGHVVGIVMGESPELFAAIGFVAVFGAAANTPIACLLMGIELFGGEIALPYGVACILAYVFSGHRGIYLAQTIDSPKSKTLQIKHKETLREVRERS
jgi:H+/Cl- antiporter ClcA